MKKFISMTWIFSVIILLAGCSTTPQTPLPATATLVDPTSTSTLEPTQTLMPTPTSTPTAGQTRIDAKGIEQVWVPPGSFQMGTGDATIE
ncbi:MAG: hypothetical protein EHM70_25215, partial [Chloroflexota bacterium]